VLNGAAIAPKMKHCSAKRVSLMDGRAAAPRFSSVADNYAELAGRGAYPAVEAPSKQGRDGGGGPRRGQAVPNSAPGP
jgi:hypothetical protein